MKKTLKRLMALLLAVMLLASMAACKDEEDAGPTAEQVRGTDAVSVGNYKLSAVEVNYFYIDTISDFCNQYGSYLSYLLNMYKPLNEQIVSDKTGQTWADAFLEMAWENIKSTYALYDLAVKANHPLPDSAKEAIDGIKKNLEDYASTNGYASADAYLEEIYGVGASLETYQHYYEVSMLANSYYAYYAESLTYDDETLREYEKDKYANYCSYSYTVYYLSAVKFRQGGTEDENGNITYSDEEKAQAILDAKAAADGLAAGEYADKDAFDAAIKALEINSDIANPTLSTANEDVLYMALESLFSEWLTKTERKEGDITVIEKTSGTDANKVTDGYYVVIFDGINDNQFALKNVRHILIKFKGGKTDATTGITTYTEAEKQAAKAEAEKLLAQWEAGDKSEDSFADLAAKETDDGNGADGGLYENIYPGQMVESFNDWCYDPMRQHGDYGLVETQYGWHIMFFSGDSDQTFRDFMISSEKAQEDLKKWYDDLLKNTTLTELDLSYVNKALILAGETAQ